MALPAHRGLVGWDRLRRLVVVGRRDSPVNGYRHWRTVAYLAVVAVGGIGLVRLESTVNRLDEVVRHNAARDCVEDWDDWENVRGAIVVGAEALIASAQNATPEVIAVYRANLEQLISDAYPDPDCDLVAAMHELAQ